MNQRIDTSELTAAETKRLEQASEASERIRRGDHFSDWLYVGQGLTTLRDVAMRDASTNRPYGKGYTAAYAKRLRAVPALGTFDNATKAHCVWLADNVAAVLAWRETLAQNVRDKLNHPTSVKRAYERAHPPLEKTFPKPEGIDAKPSKDQELHELQAEKAHLQERLAHLEGKVDGGSFDLERDSFEDIKAVIDRLPRKASLKRKLASVRAAIDAWLALPLPQSAASETSTKHKAAEKTVTASARKPEGQLGDAAASESSDDTAGIPTFLRQAREAAPVSSESVALKPLIDSNLP